MKEKVPRTRWLTWPFSSKPINIFGKGLKLKLEPEFERILEFSPAFDKRRETPNCGIHCVEMRFVLKGPKGAVQFLLYTDWQLPHILKEFKARNFHIGVMPADLGYHSPTPMYDDQRPMEDCEYLDGRPCYYDGSTLNAERAYKVLAEEGEEGLWGFLSGYYESTFTATVKPSRVKFLDGVRRANKKRPTTLRRL